MSNDEETTITQKVIKEETLNNEFNVYIKNFRSSCLYAKSELDDPGKLSSTEPHFLGLNTHTTLRVYLCTMYYLC